MDKVGWGKRGEDAEMEGRMGVVACTGSKIIVSGSHYAHIVGETRGGFFKPILLIFSLSLLFISLCCTIEGFNWTLAGSL